MGIVEPFKYDEALLQRLIREFKMSEEAARKCLKKAKNSIEQAVEYYFNDDYKDVQIEALQPANKTPKTEPAAMTEEEQLKLAMEMSKETAKERPLALPGPTPMSIDGDTHISAEEAEMNRVVLESLQAAQYRNGALSDLSLAMPDNPTLRVRDPNLPVGLKNVGNTCYFNSLLQTYNNFPPLRDRVLNFPPNVQLPQGSPPAAEHTLAFMKELQKLFALMEFGNQKYVDPSALLKKLMDRTGTKPVELGQQEDVSEFNDLVLERISEGLALAEQPPSSSPSPAAAASQPQPPSPVPSKGNELIKKMFIGQQHTIIAATETDGTPVEAKTTNEYSSLILPIGEDLADFHSSLEAEFSTHVEYTTPKTQNRFAAAEKVTWLDSVPPVIMFQENRVEYSKELKQHVKRNEPLLFDKQLFMDRYMAKNKEETTKRRKIVNELRNSLASLRTQIRPYDHFPGKSAGLIEGLEIARDVIMTKQPQASAELSSALNTLNRLITEEVAKVTELRKKEAELRHQIDSAYADMREFPYTLFGVWLHQGAPGVGHYWSYIHHPKLKKWLKYNDLRVTEVDEQTVMKEATGGYQSITASFLIYVRSDFYEQFSAAEPPKLASPILQKEVEQSNAAFQEVLQKYQASKEGPKLDRFGKAFQQRRDEAIKQAGDVNSTAELLAPKVPSFNVFLRMIGQSRYSDILILIEVFKSVFDTPIESAMEGDLKRAAEKLTSILEPNYKPPPTVIDLTGTTPSSSPSSSSPEVVSPGEQLLRDTINYAVSSSIAPIAEMKSLQMEFDLFVEATQYLRIGLQYIAEKNFNQSLPYLHAALEADKRIRFESLRRASVALPFISLAIHMEFENVKQHRLAGRLTKDMTKEIIQHSWALALAATHMLPERNSVYQAARAEFLELLSQFPEQLRLALSWEKAKLAPYAVPFTAVVKSNQHPTPEELNTLTQGIVTAASKIRAENGPFWSIYRP